MANHRRNLDNLCLLIWKNIKLQIRHPIRTFLELATPIIMLLIMLLSRKAAPPEERGPHAYPPFVPIATDAFLTNKRNLYWSPCDNSEVRRIMQTIVQPYQLNEKCFEDSQELDIAAKGDSTFGAIAFEDSLSGKDDISEKVTITIRLHSGYRTWDDWRTDGIYHNRISAGPKHWDNIYGAWSPDYFGLGFLTLQHDISIALIRSKINKTGGDDLFPIVKMVRFPYPVWLDEPFLYTIRKAMGPQLTFGFVVSCIGSVQDITREKQKQIKEAMKVMGLANWLCWLSWFIRIFTFMLITISILFVMLITPIISGSDMNVFRYANSVIVLFFFIFYICATATMCFMISVFFRRASIAVGVAGILWFLSVLPYVKLYPELQSPSLSGALAIMLTPNSAFCVGVHVIIMYEETSEGLSFENICRPIHPRYTISMCHVWLMLIIDALIYLVIALYVEALYPGEYGIPKRWDFLCHKTFWREQTKKKRHVTSSSFIVKEVEQSDAFEPEPTDMEAGIVIKDLKKDFGKNTAVDGINLNMYRGQITVLLGHNGAGKSTTMTMVTGTLPPTEGKIMVNGYMIPEELHEARSSLGWCPQHNILFDELTVGEHIYFFSRLKGLNKCEAEEEVKKFIKLLALSSKRHKKSRTLSGGMKRKLCAALALCGNSQVCLFDEPSSGVDPGARRDLWDIIQSQKEGRTILLTTQFMDEADVLGDRIAIMVSGKIHCCGSSFFLKKKFGAGYKLIIAKGTNCNVDAITELLRKYIPTIQVQSSDATQLTYLLPEDDAPVFAEMLKDLENNSDQLSVNSYGISVTTMEEVFLTVGRADHQKEATLKSWKKNNDQESLSNSSLSAWEYLSGAKLKINQFRAMLMKKYLCSLRSKIILVQLFIVSLLMAVIAIEQYDNTYTGEPESRLLTLSMYPKPVIMMATDRVNNTYYKEYKKLIKQHHAKYYDKETSDLSDEILYYIESNPYDWRWDALFGATFSDEEILTWFNPEGFHTVAVALQFSLNTIYRVKVNPHHEIQFQNHPLPNTAGTKLKVKGGDMVNTAHMMTIALIFSTAFYVFYYIRERVTRSMHLQYVAGVDIRIYWTTSYIWDYLTFLLLIVVMIICLTSFKVNAFSSIPEVGRLILLLVLFGFAVLFELHLISFVISSAEGGVAIAVFINYFLGPVACLMMGTIIMEALKGTKLAPYVNDFCIALYFVPTFAVSSALFQLSQKFTENTVCEELTASITKSQAEITACHMLETCCGIDDNYLGWDRRGIGKQLFALSVFSVIAVVIIFLKEYDVHRILKYKCSDRGVVRIPESESTEDDDVLEEERMIRNGDVSPDDCYILVKDLCKKYKKFYAVNHICLAVKKFECFGLLGVNGAGKTTTFRMMSGDLSISGGECWIYGYNIKRHPTKAMSSIGYCPQFDALLDELTGYETLYMYSVLAGIPFAQCDQAADVMARRFDFYVHLHKQVKKYSGGNKRKLSTAISFIGEPPIVFLDEPSTGMDPGTRRKLWDNLIRERDNGKCLILTSHSMEECEALCTRMAIMVNGTFRCLGSAQHLKNKFSQGHVLTIKMKEIPIVSRGADMNNIQHFVQETFEHATLTEDHFGLVIFYIPSKNVTWSRMFEKMEEAKKNLNIDDYSVSQSSLEEVFIYLTKSQRADSRS